MMAAKKPIDMNSTCPVRSGEAKTAAQGKLEILQKNSFFVVRLLSPILGQDVIFDVPISTQGLI